MSRTTEISSFTYSGANCDMRFKLEYPVSLSSTASVVPSKSLM